jgi:hypothetical protein
VSIYVEILVRAPIDALWTCTQMPALHEKWDLRFSRIDYIRKAVETDPQRFRYTTRVGFGFEVSGEGETVGQRTAEDGSRSSALRFSSAAPVSIIREGSGYWKYIPTADGVRFVTWYDYRTRFGAIGSAFDFLIFRRLLGWATAWSFDRLRLWVERGVEPAHAMRQTVIHAIARIALVCIFTYQGLVPKLIARYQDEMAMLDETGIASHASHIVLAAIGVVEVTFAAALLIAWRCRWPAWVCLNPFTLNVAVAALAAIDLLVLEDVPSAARCRRCQQLGDQ